jgi:hypothetical protein
MLNAFLNFDRFLFPQITKIIYWIGLVLIILFAVVAAFGALLAQGGVLGFIVALVGGAIGLLFWRIAVELWLVLFSIYDVLKEIRDQRGNS